jgi:hypothetical protein
VAVVRNITGEPLSLFTADAPPAQPGDDVTVSDERFANRAWPTSTWKVVTAPGKGYVGASPDDAVVYITEPDETVAELKDRAAAAGVDVTGLTKKAEIAAALAAGPTNEENS